MITIVITRKPCFYSRQEVVKREVRHEIETVVGSTSLISNDLNLADGAASTRKDLETYEKIMTRKHQFHKVASFHQHYSTFTLQTYHHPEHRFSSWSTQITGSVHGLRRSPSHLQARVQPRIHTTIPTYSFCLDKTKQSHTKSRQNTPDPAEYKNNLDLKINNTALPMATHPKVLGLTLDPKLTYNTVLLLLSTHSHGPC